MKSLTLIKAVFGILALISAGLFLTDFVPKDISLNLLVMLISAIIGLFGIDESQQQKKATGYLMIFMGAILTVVFAFRLISAF